MSNKPVAWINEHGEISIEEHWAYPTPLYTHPVEELNDGGEPVKNATYWKRQYNLMASQNDNLKSGLYHANEQIKYFEFQIEELVRQQQAEINQQQEEKKALYNLVAEQDKKIIDLAFKLAYAERSNEVEKELSK